MRHAKKPETKSHSLENKKLIETVTKIIYPWDLLEKASKSIVLNMLRQIKVTIDKEQKEIWELTHTITEM